MRVNSFRSAGSVVAGLALFVAVCVAAPARAAVSCSWLDIIFDMPCQAVPDPTPIATVAPTPVQTVAPTPVPPSIPTPVPECGPFGPSFCVDPDAPTPYTTHQGQQDNISCTGEPGSWNLPPIELQADQPQVVAGDNAGAYDSYLVSPWFQYGYHAELVVTNPNPDPMTLRVTTIIEDGGADMPCNFVIDCEPPYGRTVDLTVDPGTHQFNFRRDDAIDKLSFGVMAIVVEVVNQQSAQANMLCDGISWQTTEQGP